MPQVQGTTITTKYLNASINKLNKHYILTPFAYRCPSNYVFLPRCDCSFRVANGEAKNNVCNCKRK